MNTVWLDSSYSPLRMARPAMAYGAAAPWQSGPMDRAGFFAAYSALTFPLRVAGLDKFFNLLADWTMYLSPLEERVLHVSPRLFMRGVVVDTMCIGKVKANPDAHKRSCALQCAKSGYGLIAQDGTYLKFDETGNEKTVAALKASKKEDHLRATVKGTREGETVKVDSITLE